MTERPVEELIGWHSRPPAARGRDWRGWLASDGTYRARAEVDDLAAWLNGRISWANWQIYHDCDDYCVDVDHFDGEVVQQFLASTIRDALIAAVRHVAEHRSHIHVDIPQTHTPTPTKEA